jgi:ligand-binding SRPBCC domain-containing protein
VSWSPSSSARFSSPGSRTRPLPATVTQTSSIAAPADLVWERATTPEGINDELRPWLRMTTPRGMRGVTFADVKVGEPLGRSWILLFGFLPVDYDDIGIAELGPGKRFLERSTMLSMRSWQHERSVEPAGDGACQVTDTLTFEPRRPLAAIGAERLAPAIVRFLFRHRHRRLAKRFA